MRKLYYNMLILATTMTVGTINLAIPLPTLANTYQITPYSSKFNLSSPEIRTTINEISAFARAMNVYALMINQNPTVNFEGIQVQGHEDLPEKIKRDQENARKNAGFWKVNLKSELINTNKNIINYNEKFEKSYTTLVDAVHNKDKSKLTEVIIELQKFIQENQIQAQVLRNSLQSFKYVIAEDLRTFGGDIQILSSVLNAQTGGFLKMKQRLKN